MQVLISAVFVATAAAPRLVRAGGLHAPTRRVPAARVADRGPEGQRSARGAAQRLAAQQLQQPPARGRCAQTLTLTLTLEARTALSKSRRY